jgi:hypothetical protein
MKWSCRMEFCIHLIRAAAAFLPLVLTSVPAAFSAPLEVVYPGHTSVKDTRVDYYVKLLDLALSKTGVDFVLRPNPVPMVPARVMQIMESNEGVDVTWGPITRELEQRLLPIRIPLDKGILGWRLLLIKTRDRHAFEEINSLAQLKSFSSGQQRYWSDTDILRASGLTVVDTTGYTSLFAMLAADRFQYFPRGVAEIWNEQKSHADLGLEVEQHLALHYPAFTYFYVGKTNVKLADLIGQGLRSAIKDGTFDKLFDQYNGAALKRAHLVTRTVLELRNPLIPDQVPAQPHESQLNR